MFTYTKRLRFLGWQKKSKMAADGLATSTFYDFEEQSFRKMETFRISISRF